MPVIASPTSLLPTSHAAQHPAPRLTCPALNPPHKTCVFLLFVSAQAETNGMKEAALHRAWTYLLKHNPMVVEYFRKSVVHPSTGRSQQVYGLKLVGYDLEGKPEVRLPCQGQQGRRQGSHGSASSMRQACVTRFFFLVCRMCHACFPQHYNLSLTHPCPPNALRTQSDDASSRAGHVAAPPHNIPPAPVGAPPSNEHVGPPPHNIPPEVMVPPVSWAMQWQRASSLPC